MDCISFFGQAFWQQVIGVLLAVILGIPAALYVDRRVRAKEEARAEERDRREAELNHQQALIAIRDAVTHNQSKLLQARNDLNDLDRPNYVIFYSVDRRAIELLLPGLIETGVDLELVRRISNYRYELEHLGRKIDTQYDLAYGVQSALGNSQEMRRQIVGSILSHSQNILQRGEEILNTIDSQLN